MTSAGRERDLFLRAIDLPDGPARRAFLLHECAADAALLAKVDSLLEYHAREESFLDEPLPERFAAEAADARPPVAAGVDAESADTLALLTAADVADESAVPGRFRVDRVIDASPFGPVFAGLDRRTGADITLRVLAPRFAAAPSVRGRFLRLARHLAVVRHDAIPAILAVGEAPLPYVVVDAPGATPLSVILDGGRRWAPVAAAHLGMQVAAGLAAAHEEGLVHRALAPGNVLVAGSDRPRAWLSDLGLARSIDEEARPGADPPGRDDAFLAPEQVIGDRLDPLDHRPDLFALGCLIVALVTGRSPFAADSREATLRRVAEVAPRRGGLEALTGPLRGIVEELLQADPAQRAESAGAVSARLAAMVGD